MNRVAAIALLFILAGGVESWAASAQLPISFEPNQGQTDHRVKFVSRGPGFTLFLTPSEVVLSGGSSPLRMKFSGGNSKPEIAGSEALPGHSSYFLGRDPAKWRTGIPQYARVEYRNVYPGIDVVFYGKHGQLEYDLVVAPAADPGVIQLTFEGARRMSLDAHGDLLLETGAGQVRQRAPVVYQDAGGVRRAIPAKYTLKGKRRVGFHLAAYDRSRPLVIDPVLVYSTFLGGTGGQAGTSHGEIAMAVAVDSSGATYIAGHTASLDFPTANPFQAFSGGLPDVFVAKLNPAGSGLVYSTYLGGGGEELVSDIALDSVGNAYITGYTAGNFPTANAIFGAYQGGIYDAYVSKLNASGSALIYSTYLGGNGLDVGSEIVVDSAGNAFVTGKTRSANFPTTSGAFQVTHGGPGNFDAFVTKLNPAGSALVYSTFLGGSGGDDALGLAVDLVGQAYLAGSTDSSNFPTTAGAFQPSYAGGEFDAFVTKLNASGSGLVYSTFVGGSSGDEAFSVALDSSGSAYVAGFTNSTDFPTTAGAFQTAAAGSDDAFVVKLNPSGSALAYSTRLGGAAHDKGLAIAVDTLGEAHVSGRTASTNFPVLSALQPLYGGGIFDVFVVRLNAQGSAPVYSTYLGGPEHDESYGIAVDESCNTFIVGRTGSLSYPTTPGVFQPWFGGGGEDAFVTKIAGGSCLLRVTIDIKPGSYPNSINLGSGGTVPVAILSSSTFDARTVDPTTVTLASAPVRLRGQGTPMASFQDVNGDGLLDLVVHVSTEALQLTETDTEAILEGQTFGGLLLIRGSDTIRVVP